MSSDATRIETVKGDSAETGQPKFMASVKPVPKEICERIYAGWDGETLPTPPTTSTIRPALTRR